MTGTLPVRFVDVLRIRTFRVLFAAELQSAFGDQLARVALSVLVFSRTGSDSATALTYGLTFLPAILGGVALARIGDRWPRRAVMIGCDVGRAGAFAVMAVPGLALPVVVGLLVIAVFIGPAFNASSVSYLAATLDGGHFRLATGLRMTTNQLAQVAGFAVGGTLAAELGVHETLLINAATYLVSAGLIATLRAHRVRRAHMARHAAPERGEDGGHATASARVRRPSVLGSVLRDPLARTMLLLSGLAGFFVVPEALAIPFAHQIGASTTSTGVLLAMIPLGSAVGVVLLTRIVPAPDRRRAAEIMAVGAGLPLVVTLAVPNYAVAVGCWFVSGVAAAYQVEALTVLVKFVSDEVRARLASFCSALLLGVQGLGPLVFGAVASFTSPVTAVAVAGVAGSSAALVATGWQRRATLISRRTALH